MISPTIRELIAGRRFQRSLVVDIVPHLPPEDEELDRWIEEAVRENDQPGFFYVVLAALVGERPVDSRHLVNGLRMMTHYTWIGLLAMHMQGEVAENLVEAVRRSSLQPLARGHSLFAAAVWHRTHREGRQPPAMVEEVRRLARVEKLGSEEKAVLYSLAAILDDEGVTAVVEKYHRVPVKGLAQDEGTKFADNSAREWSKPIVNAIAVQPRPVTMEGFTMRRAVARISRNDPCTCGSGKKYKRCCHDKDQERLQNSTDVSGKTRTELDAEKEQFLTQERLRKLPAHDLARLDPLKIDPGLHEEYFVLLTIHLLFERAAEAFESMGYQESLLDLWQGVIYYATKQGSRPLIRRLSRWHPDADTSDDHLHTSTGLILLEDDPGKMLEEALQCVSRGFDYEEANDLRGLMGVASAMLMTKFRPFGIFIARSLIPIVPRNEAIQLLDAIFEARDALNLPPDDPYSDVLDRRFAGEPVDEGKDAGALREAQRKLEAKAAEVRRIKEDLEQLRREVERREKPAKTTMTTAGTKGLPPAEEERLRELRGKVSELKSILNERHEERVTLRRELQQAHTDLDILRQKQTAPTPVSNHGSDREEALLLPGDVSGNQPVRVLEFPRKFHETLSSLPKPVARGAMTMLGRLAAGEPAAYVGVVRLKDCPETLRQRIGIDHRLLFRLHADRVEVVDLINRRDLERRIKTLI